MAKLPELPPLTPDGLLPPGDYVLTLEELAESFLVQGPDGRERSRTWDAEWRAFLVRNLSILIKQLWHVGINEIFIDGSFVETKDHPNDIDGYFECEMQRLISGQLQQELNLLDPHKIWTWEAADRLPYRGYPKVQLPMWHAYRVELYPHFGQFSGIRDVRGWREMKFPSAFRQTRRNGKPRDYQNRRAIMIRSEAEYQNCVKLLAEEAARMKDEQGRLMEMGLSKVEITRAMDPVRIFRICKWKKKSKVTSDSNAASSARFTTSTEWGSC